MSIFDELNLLYDIFTVVEHFFETLNFRGISDSHLNKFIALTTSVKISKYW